ncbi:hypothetical protein MYOV011v1_p0122 [Vibrio phage 6E35.1a]|nr:hypothetical protein MYOV011v1_p0122 [Vibrio phage 6E35.1a]
MMILLYILLGFLLTALVGDTVRSRYVLQAETMGKTPLPMNFFIITCVLILPICLLLLGIKKVLQFFKFM